MIKFRIPLVIILLCVLISSSVAYAEDNIETAAMETITIENSEEFAAVFATKNEFADIVKEFANLHIGELIEFDGYIASIANHGSFKTRFDYLIYCGPYRETDFYGPMFQFEDVNYNDFHLTGETIPDTVSLGMNLHIIAEVVEYKEMSGLFIIKPIEVEATFAE